MQTIPHIIARLANLTISALSVLTLFGTLFAAKAAHAGIGAPTNPAHTVQIIVKFRSVGPLDGKNDHQAFTAALSEISSAHPPEQLSSAAVRVQIDADTIIATLSALNARDDVAFAEVDEVFTPMTVIPNDGRFSEQVQYQNTDYGANLPDAWAISTGAPTVTIAVLDTGVRFDHPEFAGRLLAGYDFVSNPNTGNDNDGRDADANDPGDWVTADESSAADSAYNGCAVQDSTWHGTAMAGLLGATGNNAQGIAGVNWQSKLLPVRVLGKCGGSSSDIADAIRWAVGLDVPGVPDNPTPAQILNLSLGRPGRCNNTLQSAINDAVSVGAILVVAAGNNGINAAGNSPANCSGVITVGASTTEGNRPFYSSYGELVDIAAPGGNATFNSPDALLSLSNTGTRAPVAAGYAPERGTSISTAVIAGVVSLMKSVQPSLTTSEVISLLQHTAHSYANVEACSDHLCSGIVNAGAAVQAARDFRRAQARYTYVSQIFLPTLSNTHAGSSVTPIVAGDAAVAIPNGNFELGNQVWSSQNTQTNQPVIVPNGQLPGGVQPYDGSYAAWLGSGDSSDSRIQQTLDVPAEAGILTFYSRILSSDTSCKGDIAYIQINDTTVQRYALCDASQTNDWMQRRVDLSAFANQQVKLTMRVTTNAQNSSHLLIDALKFTSR